MAKESSIIVKKFAGIDNVNRPEKHGDGRFFSMTNVDITESGSVKRRPGYETAYSGTVHSMLTDGNDVLFREGEGLYRLEPNGTATALKTGIIGGLAMRGVVINGTLYFSDGISSGVYSNRAVRNIGLPVPPSPTLEATAGDMIPGKYQVSLSYVRNDGHEGGACVPVWCNATEGGVIVNGIVASTDANVDGICVYLSSVDGGQLWRYSTIQNASASLAIRNGPIGAGSPISTLNMSALPSGNFLEFHRGRLYSADGSTLWYSEPWNYEICAMDHNFFHFPHNITMLVSVEGGLWVGTDREVVFLFGEDPATEGGLRVRMRVNDGAILGSATRCDSSLVRFANMAPGPVAVWASGDGIFFGDSTGNYKNITGDYYVPGGDVGISSFINEEGDVSQYVFNILSQPGYGSGIIQVGTP